MRSRTLREGSVGLLILLGIGVFGLLFIWVRGLNPGNRSYRAVIEFANVGGMQKGAPVRFRGVTVGKVTEISPGANVVNVEIEISSDSVIIPRSSIIQVNQAGLIGETSVDITPISDNLSLASAVNPLDTNCQESLIICNGDRLTGLVGVNFNELISATVKLTNLVADPTFFGQLRTLTQNTADAAAGVTNLTKEVSRLSRSVERELSSLSAAATSTTAEVGRAANQIGLTAAQVNNLLLVNRATLISTLNNLNTASYQLQGILNQVSPVVDNGEFATNLRTLSLNASQASANLRNLSEALGSQENVLLLQQTLDSARATFQNAQKITADLDELTGDPAFRQNLRDLVNGLNSLVSSTDQLQQQTELARVLEPAAIAINAQNANPSPTHHQISPSSSHLHLLVPTTQPQPLPGSSTGLAISPMDPTSNNPALDSISGSH